MPKVISTMSVCKRSCCPEVSLLDSGDFQIGEIGFGYTYMNALAFKEFIENAKSGKFDSLIGGGNADRADGVHPAS
jgi:hypothetical protein